MVNVPFSREKPRGQRANHTADSRKPPAGFLFVGLVIVVLLSACESKPTAAPPVVVKSPTSTRVTPAAKASPTRTHTPEPIPTLGIDPADLKGVKVSFWHPWSGESGQAIQDSIDEFNAENEYGITVDSTYQGNYNDLYQKIDTAIASDKPPNLGVGYPYQIQAWNKGGKVVDLNSYVNDPDWGIPDTEQADFNLLFWNQDVIAGKRIGFPAQRSAPLLYYNTSWAKELGFDAPPETPQDFREQACAAAQANTVDANPDNDGTGGWAVNTSPEAILSWLYAFGAEVVAPNGDGYQFNTPQAEDALGFLKDLYDAGCSWQPTDESAEEEFATRKALFTTDSLANLSDQTEALQRVENKDQWTVMAFPTPRKQPAIVVYGPSFVLFEGTPEQKLAAWLVIKWLASPSQQAKFIETSGTYPTRTATLDSLKGYAAKAPQWVAAQELLTNARAEPNLQSWSVVRWVVGDVGTQVFRYYFTPDRIPDTLALMDETAAELHERIP